MLDSGFVRYALNRTAASAEKRGMPRIELQGQLIRPTLAYEAALQGKAEIPSRFWSGALAIQLAHEASLVHDDIIDEAKTRRGEPTTAATHGIARALVYGDHLLTSAYRLAAETESIEFVTLFSRCVERTVAGEIAQAKSLGRKLTLAEYRHIAESKSGELLAASLALGVAFTAPERMERCAKLGRELGLLYQMLDDLLDYCPTTDTGKPALGDFRQQRWTWPLLELGDFSFDEPCEDIAARLCRRAGANSPLRRCLERMNVEAQGLTQRLREEFGAEVGVSLVHDWMTRAAEAVLREERGAVSPFRVTGPSVALRSRVPVNDDVVDYLADNSKSFRFASRFFPGDELTSVAHVYAFCRVTDDLVDKCEPSTGERLLDEWMTLARSGYDGLRTGFVFLDRVMREMRSHNIPFDYASELAEGMRMDLRGQTYATFADLRTYTYRVASVVGLWVTELAGVRDSLTLRHAESLGHAMQLTNILRDVGEDARNGRIYLPADMLDRYGIMKHEIVSAAFGAVPVPTGFAHLVEELMHVAESDYQFALDGVRNLPASFQRPVAVAAHVYRGIHAEIRRNDCDTLTRRAVTSARSKAILAARALWSLETSAPLVRRSA